MNSFSDALTSETNRRRDANVANQQLLASLPENPERGSYYWWSRICRENSGQHALDSGIAYGYAYNEPVPPGDSDPVTVEFYNGEFEMATINAIEFLQESTESEDETAVAIEQVLYWCGAWLHPRESWGKCVSKFASDLDRLHETICEEDGTIHIDDADDGSQTVARILKDAMSGMSRYDFPRGYRVGKYPNERIDKDGFFVNAIQAFPAQALKAMWDSDALDLSIGRGDLTYNHENDLSQDFQYELIGVGRDIYDEAYAIIQVHTGCDIRGGYAAPVVAAIDVDRFFSWQVDMWCQECDETFYDGYSYSKELENKRLYIDYEKLIAKESPTNQIANGQTELPGCKAETLSPSESMALEYARQIIADEPEADTPPITRPHGAILNEEGEPVKFPNAEGFDCYPASRVALLCPGCGEYAMHVYKI